MPHLAVKLRRVDRKARWGRNPTTGEKIKIAAKKVIRATPPKVLKDLLAADGLDPLGVMPSFKSLWREMAEACAYPGGMIGLYLMHGTYTGRRRYGQPI